MAFRAYRSIKFRATRPLFALTLTAALLLSGCGDKPPATLQPVRVGMEATAVNSLIYIAQEKGFFEDNGIELILRDDFASGSAAAAAMLEGAVDIATAAEFAVVRQALSGQDIATLGSIDMFTHMKLVVRTDRGIHTAADLAGKRIGVPLGSAADFVLGRFLNLSGIMARELTIVDVQAPHALAAITAGEVDAIIAWQPNIMAMQDALGDKAAVLPVQSGQPLYCAVVSSGEWADANPGLVVNFLKALSQAEDFLIGNPEICKTIVQIRLGYDDRYTAAIWPEHRLTLRLDQSLVLAMEDQARWLIHSGLTEAVAVPIGQARWDKSHPLR